MPRMTVLVQMALVQLGTMFLLNQLQGTFPATRPFIKGNGIFGGGNGLGGPGVAA